MQSAKEFNTILKNTDHLKSTVAQFCKIANIEPDWFRTIYRGKLEHRAWKEKQDRLFEDYKDKLSKSFRSTPP